MFTSPGHCLHEFEQVVVLFDRAMQTKRAALTRVYKRRHVLEAYILGEHRSSLRNLLLRNSHIEGLYVDTTENESMNRDTRAKRNQDHNQPGNITRNWLHIIANGIGISEAESNAS